MKEIFVVVKGFKVGVPADYVPCLVNQNALQSVENAKADAVATMDDVKKEIVQTVLYRIFEKEGEEQNFINQLRDKYAVAEFAFCQLCRIADCLDVFDKTADCLEVE